MSQTRVAEDSPRSAVDIRPARGVRTVGRMLAPEGFLQFVQPVGLAEAQIREIALIELSQQTPRLGAFHCLPQAM
jgi:hypothetical protein